METKTSFWKYACRGGMFYSLVGLTIIWVISIIAMWYLDEVFPGHEAGEFGAMIFICHLVFWIAQRQNYRRYHSFTKPYKNNEVNL